MGRKREREVKKRKKRGEGDGKREVEGREEEAVGGRGGVKGEGG